MTVKIIVGYLRLMQRVLQHYQLDLREIGVPQLLIQQFYAYLDDQHEEFDSEQYSHILSYLQKQFDRPICLVMAEQVALQDAGLVGYLASTSFDLQQALSLLQKYYPLLYKHTNISTLQLAYSNSSIKIYWMGLLQEWRYFCELDLALLYTLAQLVVQDSLIAPDQVTLGYQPELALYHYQKFFHCPVKITDQEYGIQFPEKILSVRSLSADRELNQVLSSQAQQSLHAAKDDQQHFKQKVMKLLAQGMLEQESLQSYVAGQLHCSERTLQRQLAHYALNFQELLDEYRFEQSKLFLQQGMSLIEIAAHLGYADQSAFGRAFKRWSAQTPRQYLKQLTK